MRQWRLWPRSLSSRTAAKLLAGLVIVQGAGLLGYAWNEIDLRRSAAAQETGIRIAALYRSVVLAQEPDRAALLHDIDTSSPLRASLDAGPVASTFDPAPPPIQRALRSAMQGGPVPPGQRWRELMIREEPQQRRVLVSMHLPSGEWLNVRVTLDSELPFLSPAFLATFAGMLIASCLLVAWAMRQSGQPMRDLAQAADQLGMDVNAPKLPERGSAEAVRAARAFNVMAERIRRFVRDRTFLLTAIGHDLRTPITRLKLRAEWMEDEEQQRKMLADLDELESMVAATLAFGRDDATAEALTALDLAELLRTISESATDARPDMADRILFDGPAHQVVRARPLAMKRALTNLVQNALNYGGAARIGLATPRDGMLNVTVDDEGPGIPQAELERVFEPFHRLESSRNRETGGTGLGLPIARNIVRAHGGDVVLANRPTGGLRATVSLPA